VYVNYMSPVMKANGRRSNEKKHSFFLVQYMYIISRAKYTIISYNVRIINNAKIMRLHTNAFNHFLKCIKKLTSFAH